MVMSLLRLFLMRLTMEICEGGLVRWRTLRATHTFPSLLSVSPMFLPHEAYSLLAPCAATPCWCCSWVLLVQCCAGETRSTWRPARLSTAAGVCLPLATGAEFMCQALKVFQRNQVPSAGVHNNWPAEEAEGKKTFFCWLLVRIFVSDLVTTNNT